MSTYSSPERGSQSGTPLASASAPPLPEDDGAEHHDSSTPQAGPELAGQMKALHDEIIKYSDEMTVQISNLQDHNSNLET